MRNTIIKALVLGANFLFYFVQQIVSVFVAFWLYGSGATFSKNSEKVGVAFLLIHIVLISYLFYKRRFISSLPLFTIAVLMTITMYVYLNFYYAKDYGY